MTTFMGKIITIMGIPMVIITTMEKNSTITIQRIPMAITRERRSIITGMTIWGKASLITTIIQE